VLNEQRQVKSIFSQDVCFNASTDVFNKNGRFAKFTETINRTKVDCMCIFPNNKIHVKIASARDDIDPRMFCMDEISDLHCDYKYKKMIVTYKKDEWLENDTDDDEYQTRSKFLNYESSVIKDRSYANSHFKESNVSANDSYKHNLKNFDIIKVVKTNELTMALPTKKNSPSAQPSITSRGRT